MNNNIFEQSDMNPTFIFVDGSYYNFYRYFALMQWWKNAYPDEPLEDPYQNEKFVDKFKNCCELNHENTSFPTNGLFIPFTINVGTLVIISFICCSCILLKRSIASCFF